MVFALVSTKLIASCRFVSTSVALFTSFAIAVLSELSASSLAFASAETASVNTFVNSSLTASREVALFEAIPSTSALNCSMLLFIKTSSALLVTDS